MKHHSDPQKSSDKVKTQMKNYFFLSFFVSSLALAQVLKVKIGPDPSTDIISENYEAGPFLMYDCSNQHWVCVLESYYNECEKNRQTELLTDKTEHSCAPMGEFPNKISCFQRQLFLTTHNHGTRFCVKNSN